MSKEGKKETKQLERFTLEKVYGDFKRLHSFIIETF